MVEKLFASEDYDEVVSLLVEECGDNLPYYGQTNEVQLERVRFAVLKLSGGSVNDLVDSVVLAQTDWRDALMAAGFGHSVTAHLSWAETVLNSVE